MIKLLKLLPLCLISFFASSCSDDDNDEMVKEIDNPTLYNFSRDGASSVSFSGQTTRIGMATELIGAMKDFSQSESVLLEMYANETLLVVMRTHMQMLILMNHPRV